MKILHCLDTLAVGGAERVGIDACNLLVKNENYKVELLLIREGGPLIEALSNEVPVKVLGFYKKTSIKGWISLINALRGFDIIHVHMRHTYGRIKIASMLSGLNTKIIFHDHFGDIEHNKSVPIYLKGFFKPKYYIGVSQELTLWARNFLKLNHKSIWVLPNTIARPVKTNANKNRQKVLVMVSNLRKTKNIEFAIELAKLSGLKLDIYGQVIDLDYFQELKNLNVDNNINFITDVNDVFPYLHNYRLAIHTAKSETGPLVVMEYLKSGTNFLAFNTGEVIRQIKEDLPRNVLYDFNVSNWLNSIKSLLTNSIPEDRLKEVFELYFETDSYLKNLINIYKWVEEN